MTSVFISHNHEDKPFARKLASRLQQDGYMPWVDEFEMHVGDSMIAKIENGIDSCRYLAAILSPNSVKSEWVRRELYAALTQEMHSGAVKVLPILYLPCTIPAFLSDKLYANFSGDFEFGYSAVLRRLKDDAIRAAESEGERKGIENPNWRRELWDSLTGPQRSILRTLGDFSWSDSDHAEALDVVLNK